MIESYFAQIKAVIDQYGETNFVLEARVSFETRPGEQGYLAGAVRFVDNSALYFREYLDVVLDTVDKLMYSYHYQNEQLELIFRYDNAGHRPPLAWLEHKHLPAQIIEAAAPTLADVLAEIARARGWL